MFLTIIVHVLVPRHLDAHVVLTVADDHDLRADEVRNKDPLGTRHRDNERAHTGAEDVGEDHGEQQERDVGNDVVDLDHPLVHLLGEAPERADRNADEHIDGRADEGDDDGVSRARPDSVKYLVADVVGAEDVLGARLQELHLGIVDVRAYRWGCSRSASAE